MPTARDIQEPGLWACLALRHSPGLGPKTAKIILAHFETAEQAWTASNDLAHRFGLTLYDATYLELAQRLRLPLATLDRELRKAAKKSGVQLLGK